MCTFADSGACGRGSDPMQSFGLFFQSKTWTEEDLIHCKVLDYSSYPKLGPKRIQSHCQVSISVNIVFGCII